MADDLYKGIEKNQRYIMTSELLESIEYEDLEWKYGLTLEDVLEERWMVKTN